MQINRLFLPAIVVILCLCHVTVRGASQKPNKDTALRESWTDPDSITMSWPAIRAPHRTSKYEVWIDDIGQVSANSRTGLRFPLGSDLIYLYSAEIQVGGIVGDDTLFSQVYGFYNSIDTPSGRFYVTEAQELYAADAPNGETPALMPLDINTASGYTSLYVDTFTNVEADRFPLLNIKDFDGSYHKPMGIQIRQKSYSVNKAPFKNILLLDYTVMNIGKDGSILMGSAELFLWSDIELEGRVIKINSNSYEIMSWHRRVDPDDGTFSHLELVLR